MQFIWNFCTCLRSIRESEGISFWFWTDRIKHTCYIEIIQDQYAIDNFSYCFNSLLCALGKGWGLWQILYYISWNWWDKIFFLKLSTYTKYWHLNTHRYELNFSYSFIDMSMAFEMLIFDALKFNWFVIYTCILLKDFWLVLWPIPFLLQWSWLETVVWVKVISCPDSPETNST